MPSSISSIHRSRMATDSASNPVRAKAFWFGCGEGVWGTQVAAGSREVSCHPAQHPAQTDRAFRAV